MRFRRAFVFTSLYTVISILSIAQTTGSQPTAKPKDSIEARVEACIACHGQQGRDVDNVHFPSLAGKPAGYLYNQLIAFRNGTRKYAPMNYLLAYLPDPYLYKMAAYFSEQHLPSPPPTAVAPAVRSQGQRIVTEGIAERKIPACVACHGIELGGREPGIPGLLGLRADYISAQLGAWRYGTRTALAPDCMQFIASSLTEPEVAAVAAWLSSRPVPASSKPIRQGPAQLPLACGSQKVAS